VRPRRTEPECVPPDRCSRWLANLLDVNGDPARSTRSPHACQQVAGAQFPARSRNATRVPHLAKMSGNAAAPVATSVARAPRALRSSARRSPLRAYAPSEADVSKSWAVDRACSDWHPNEDALIHAIGQFGALVLSSCAEKRPPCIDAWHRSPDRHTTLIFSNRFLGHLKPSRSPLSPAT